MKTALYLLVVIAAFALIPESAAAGLFRQKRFLNGLVESLDSTLSGVGNLAKDSLQGLTDALQELEKQAKEKGAEIKINIETQVKNTSNNVKQQIQKLKETLTDLLKQVKAGVEDVFKSTNGNWKKLKEETANKVKEIMDKHLNESTSSKMEDIKKGISSDLKELAETTADKVKCDEKEKKEFGNELNNKMENIADAWYKKTEQ